MKGFRPHVIAASTASENGGAGSRLPRAVAPVFPHCRQEADFKLKTPLDSHMLPNASENEPRHAALHGVDICLPASRQKSRSKSRESSNASYYLIQHCRCGAHRCCGMDRYLNSVSKIPTRALAVRSVLARGEGKEFAHSGVARSEYVAK
jgi:hypothetical protein